jgi:hypothetical protein
MEIAWLGLFALESMGILDLRALAGERRLETYFFAATAASLPATIAGEKDEDYSS